MMKWKRAITIICLVVCVASAVNPVYGKCYAVKANEENTEAGEGDTKQSTDVQSDKITVQAGNPAGDSTSDAAADDDTTEQDTAGSTTVLVIDNKNLYEGMEKSYSKGYVPKIKGSQAVIVLPLLAKRKLSGDRIKTKISLGETETAPFIHKNYEKDIKLKKHKAEKNGKTAECYLVTYKLDLKKDRYNGSYPVVISVTAEDEEGNEVYQDFTVYVTITDGKVISGGELDSGYAGGEELQFAPKVIVDSYKFSKETIQSGDEFTVDITLLNTSKTETVKNMLVTAAPDENIELLSKSDSIYIEELGTSKTCAASYTLKANAAAPQGQYNIALTMDYADSKGNPYTAQGTVKVTVGQLVKIEIDPVVVPEEIQMGETVELQTQVMNLGRGKLYNVRAVVEADGLKPSGTAFIGDIEAGTAMSGSTELTAVGLSGDSLYGKTKGTVTFYYEDEAGTKMSKEMIFETSIKSPLNEKKDEQAADDTSQWWVIMAVIVVILVMSAVLLFLRRTRYIQETEEESDEE